MKVNGLQHSFNIFRQLSTCHTIKTYSITFQTIYPEICAKLIFQKRVLDQFLHHIQCMIFQEKIFSCYILLTDQILYNSFHNDVENIKYNLVKNSYPPFLIDKVMKKYLDHKISSNKKELKDAYDVDYFKLPYISNLLRHIENKISKLRK